MVGGSSGETKIAEGIRDAKNRRFVLYIAFAGKSGGDSPPPPAPPPMEYQGDDGCYSILLCYPGYAILIYFDSSTIVRLSRLL